MEDTFKHILRHNKLSYTRQRAKIFAVLSTTTKAVSMNELLNFCSDIDRVSVYRIIDQFEKVGIVTRVQIGWKYKIELSDIFKIHHHHVSCISCGESIDIEEPAVLETFIEQMTKDLGYKITRHTLELHGFCPNCNSKT